MNTSDRPELRPQVGPRENNKHRIALPPRPVATHFHSALIRNLQTLTVFVCRGHPCNGTVLSPSRRSFSYRCVYTHGPTIRPWHIMSRIRATSSASFFGRPFARSSFLETASPIPVVQFYFAEFRVDSPNRAHGTCCCADM